MITVDSMQKATEEAPSVWLQYVNSKQKANTSPSVFCFFEGEDRKYYVERIGKVFIDFKILSFTCGNRKNVIKVCKKIVSEGDNTDELLFFVDRDFNLDSYEEDSLIYQTPEYSIENLYCKVQTIEKIIEIEFGMKPMSGDWETVKQLYGVLLEEFMSYYSCVNIWYLACKKNGLDVCIDNFKPNKDFDFVEGKLITKNGGIAKKRIVAYYREKLQKDFEKKKKYSEKNLSTYIEKEDVINNTMEELEKKYDSNKDFRGKFLLIFLRKFIGLIKDMNKENRFESKYLQVYIDENQKNILSAFSSYAITPKCLNNYLSSRKSNLAG